MQNNSNHPYTSEELLWRKRPHPSRVDDYDSDESSRTGSPWRAMKRLRVAGPLLEDFREQEQMCPEIERVVSHNESVTFTAAKDQEYANFNKLLGALHLERKNRESIRTTPAQPSNEPSVLQQFSHEGKVREDNQMMISTPDKGRTRRNQTKLKTQSKLA